MSATFLEPRSDGLSPVRGSLRQRGFALVTAIFLLVVLAALGAVMVTLATVQHTTAAQDIQGSRAYHAARVGIDWAIYRIMVPENTNPQTPPTPPSTYTPRADCSFIPATSTTGNLGTLNGSLNGFVVNVTCSGGTDIAEGDNTIRVFTLTSPATFGAGGTVDRVERQISATITTCRKTATGAQCVTDAEGG
ncbi:MAG: hypothetical protein VB032_00840 [Burkholderiaceae bacterium]|nr:hypothetical protein [Burkholderiaceae bacterium]